MAMGAKRRILVADDEDFIASLIAELLEDMEYDVQTVYNGRDAIEAILKEPPDLVISDIMMPHADGLIVLGMMREHPHTRSTPVILMSAASLPKLPEEDRVRFIPKPFNIEYVVDTVETCLAS